MASLSLRGIYKRYPGGVVAVSDVNINIKDKEFIVLVGPSGCGKSTTLRMIAGLEEISEGELFIGERLVNDVAPKDRDIAMVFQNYALYPHMTVFDNMAFGLKLRKTPKDEITGGLGVLRAEFYGVLAVHHQQLRVDEVHLRRTDKARNKLVYRILIKVDRRIDLLNITVLHNNDSVTHRHSLCLVMGYIDKGRTQLLMELGKLGSHLSTHPENIHDEEMFLSNAKTGMIEATVDVTEMLGAETYLYKISNRLKKFSV